MRFSVRLETKGLTGRGGLTIVMF